MSQESTQVVSGNDTQPRHLGLPFDIVEHIAQYMPISKVRLAVLEWCTDEQTKKAVLHRRSNILLYMRHFFREPAKVLDLMRACGVIWCKFHSGQSELLVSLKSIPKLTPLKLVLGPKSSSHPVPALPSRRSLFTVWLRTAISTAAKRCSHITCSSSE